MENARILLIEGNIPLSNFLCTMFKRRGHEVVSKAFDFEGAKKVIESGELQRNEVNVAIVVGNLLSTERHERIFGGPMIAEAIKNINPGIRIIAYTRHLGKEANFGDFHVPKDSVSEEIFETVKAA